MRKESLLADLMASFVVFLVALPLCMGIALASGVPPEKGLISGIVGGLIVGVISGSPMQVSGPAAGLVVIVWQIVADAGLPGLAFAVTGAGVIQILSGFAGFGRWFRAVSPTVIYGMLSGIGILIFASQFHVMVDDTPVADGIENIITIPAALMKVSMFSPHSSHTTAALVGTLTIVVILLWEKLRPESLRIIPGALLGIGIASVVTALFAFDIRFVQLPESLLETFDPADFSGWMSLMNGDGLIMVFTVAFVASAETLLCASAVDKLHNGKKTNYDKELFAQGVGNVICGFFAALPMTGVIVRSSANVSAGAQTRLSAILHGAWLVGFIVLFPTLLTNVPTSSLAALLVYIGYKLTNPEQIAAIARQGREEFLIFLITVISIVSFDLLTGIMLGFGATLFQIVYKATYFHIEVIPCAPAQGGQASQGSEGTSVRDEGEREREFNVELYGAATFLKLPIISETLEELPADAVLHVHFHGLTYIDHACLELLTEWGDQHKRFGGAVYLEWDRLHHYADPKTRKKVIYDPEQDSSSTARIFHE